MTPSEHDDSESAQEQRTTELYPFSREYPGAASDTRPDVPAMEPLPDPYALPDPGYPEMPARTAEPGQPGGEPETRAAAEPVNEPGSRSWPPPPGWPPVPPSFPPAADEPGVPQPPAPDWPAGTRPAAIRPFPDQQPLPDQFV